MTKSRHMHRCGLATTAIVAAALASSAAAAPSGIATETQRGTLTALNGTGAHGTISMQLRGNRYLTVQIDATGLEPGIQHLGHIHGLASPGNVQNSV